MVETVEVTVQAAEITVPAGRAVKGEKIAVPLPLARQLAEFGSVTLPKGAKAEKGD